MEQRFDKFQDFGKVQTYHNACDGTEQLGQRVQLQIHIHYLVFFGLPFTGDVAFFAAGLPGAFAVGFFTVALPLTGALGGGAV